MRLRLIAAAACLVLSGPALAESSPVGRWLVPDASGVIEIVPCRDGLCGRIVGQNEIRDAQGNPTRDVHGVPHCGLIILHGTRLAEPGHWGGLITNPDEGSDWRCEFWLGVDGRLRLRGYILTPLLGQTQTWTPYTGQVGADCAMSG